MLCRLYLCNFWKLWSNGDDNNNTHLWFPFFFRQKHIVFGTFIRHSTLAGGSASDRITPTAATVFILFSLSSNPRSIFNTSKLIRYCCPYTTLQYCYNKHVGYYAFSSALSAFSIKNCSDILSFVWWPRGRKNVSTEWVTIMQKQILKKQVIEKLLISQQKNTLSTPSKK